MKLVVFGYGNLSRGDDAIGPLLLGRVEDLGHNHITCVEDFQLQIDHSLDLNGQDLALFIDAGIGTPKPYSFTEVKPSGELNHTSHALSPQTVLDVFIKINGKAPPPSFLLCVAGCSFELGEDISLTGKENFDAAWKFLQIILNQPNLAKWREAQMGETQIGETMKFKAKEEEVL